MSARAPNTTAGVLRKGLIGITIYECTQKKNGALYKPLAKERLVRVTKDSEVPDVCTQVLEGIAEDRLVEAQFALPDETSFRLADDAEELRCKALVSELLQHVRGEVC